LEIAMRTNPVVSIAVLLCPLVLSAAGCGRPTATRHAQSAKRPGDALDHLPAREDPKPQVLEPICSVQEAHVFQSLTQAAIRAIDAGQRSEVIKAITALESTWDDMEKALAPRSPATWRVLDVTLDRAIAALRGSRTDPARGRVTLVDLAAQLGQATTDHAIRTPEAVSVPTLPTPPAASEPAAVYSDEEAAVFKTTIRATIRLLDAARTKEAIATLTDLEADWDAAGDALKARDPATWRLLDNTLDRAIGAIRSTAEADVPAGRAALGDLLAKLERATVPSHNRGR